MWMNKKGVEPLIAAVLLIVVVIGIGAVVTGIIRNYVTENKQTITEKASDMKCGVEVVINVPVVNDNIKICKNTSDYTINFTLENTGSATIDELQMKVFGSSGFDLVDTVFAEVDSPYENTGMPPGATAAFSVPYDDVKVGDFQEVKLVPRVKVIGRTDKAFCADAALTFADLSDVCN